MSNPAPGIDHAAATQNYSNAAAALSAYQGDEGAYMSNVNSLLAKGNPFEAKDYLTKQNLETSGAMNAENDAAKQRLESTAARTGTNTAAIANEESANARAGQRDITQYNAARDTANENTWLAQQDKLLSDEQAGASSEAGVYGTSLGAQSSDLSSMTQADDAEEQARLALVGDAIGAGGAVGAAFCPAVGTLYLMADGTEKRVEDLLIGDKIMGIDDEPQTIEEIESGVFPVVQTITENGFVTLTSLTHAFALPRGGFVVAARSLGKRLVTEKGDSHVERLELAGEALVFNIITDGSHTYRADGVWSLGVGEAERAVNMATWARIGHKLSAGIQ
jgi:hypothetical protein